MKKIKTNYDLFPEFKVLGILIETEKTGKKTAIKQILEGFIENYPLFDEEKEFIKGLLDSV